MPVQQHRRLLDGWYPHNGLTNYPSAELYRPSDSNKNVHMYNLVNTGITLNSYAQSSRKLESSVIYKSSGAIKLWGLINDVQCIVKFQHISTFYVLFKGDYFLLRL